MKKGSIKDEIKKPKDDQPVPEVLVDTKIFDIVLGPFKEIKDHTTETIKKNIHVG